MFITLIILVDFVFFNSFDRWGYDWNILTLYKSETMEKGKVYGKTKLSSYFSNERIIQGLAIS